MKYRFVRDSWGHYVLQIQRDTGEWEFADRLTAQLAADTLNNEQITL